MKAFVAFLVAASLATTAFAAPPVPRDRPAVMNPDGPPAIPEHLKGTPNLPDRPAVRPDGPPAIPEHLKGTPNLPDRPAVRPTRHGDRLPPGFAPPRSLV